MIRIPSSGRRHSPLSDGRFGFEPLSIGPDDWTCFYDAEVTFFIEIPDDWPSELQIKT